jgi:di/tricarboxylate transporter
LIDILLLLAVILFALLAFAFEWLPIDQVALATLGLLLLFGLVTPTEAVSGFSNPAVITVMMMFILSESLVQSGVMRQLGHRINRLSGHSHWRGSVVLLALTGALSAFINNVAAVSILMPVSIQLARHYRVSPSKILLPLSYAAIFGGACTLIGTSTNLIVDALAQDHGLPAFTMFEFLELGLILFVVGIAYTVAVPMRFLPSRSILSSLTRKYHLSSFLTEFEVPPGSPLVRQTVLSSQLSERFQLNVLEILRGKKRIAQDLRNTPVEPGDLLIARGATPDLVSFKEHFGLLMLTDTKLSDADLADENNILAEVQLSPTSRLAGRTLKGIDFRRIYGCFVLALNRTGETIRDKIAFIPLKPWDTLLVFGPRSRVEALYGRVDFIPLQELDVRLQPSPRWWISALVVPAVVVLAATGFISILKAALLGVVAVLVTGALTSQQAYKAVNWSVIFLVAAILPLGVAMEKTGLARILGESIAGVGTRLGPIAVLSLLYLATSVLTEVMSNNSTAILMVPVAFTAAGSLGVDPKSFVMAVAFAASASFLTPMGYKTNAMVYGPGGYRFTDYLKTGFPLKLVFWVMATFLVPVFWPLSVAS